MYLKSNPNESLYKQFCFIFTSEFSKNAYTVRWRNASGNGILNDNPIHIIISKFATSGNRTRASRVAGENSTTEPTLLASTSIFISYIFIYALLFTLKLIKMAISKYALIFSKITDVFETFEFWLSCNDFQINDLDLLYFR